MKKFKEQLITMLIEHSKLIYSIVSDMGVYYSSWAGLNDSAKVDLEKKKNKMLLSEEDADNIKIRLIKEFSEAGPQGLGDYIALVLKMDNVINTALEFIDILGNIDKNIDDNIKKRYHKLINSSIGMADMLKKTIKSLRDKPEDVFVNTTKIHETENEIDEVFREFLNYIYDDRSLDIRLVLKIRDSIIVLEELADRIHDIADVIRVVLYQ